MLGVVRRPDLQMFDAMDFPPRPLVLIVEDDDVTRARYRQVLLEAGYEVKAVSDGLAALLTIDEGPLPHAVVLDVMLPHVPGLDVVHELRAHEFWRDIPVIVVTAADATVDTSMSEVQACLRQPVDPDVLIATVARVVREPKRV